MVGLLFTKMAKNSGRADLGHVGSVGMWQEGAESKSLVLDVFI